MSNSHELICATGGKLNYFCSQLSESHANRERTNVDSKNQQKISFTPPHNVFSLITFILSPFLPCIFFASLNFSSFPLTVNLLDHRLFFIYKSVAIQRHLTFPAFSLNEVTTTLPSGNDNEHFLHSFFQWHNSHWLVNVWLAPMCYYSKKYTKKFLLKMSLYNLYVHVNEMGSKAGKVFFISQVSVFYLISTLREWEGTTWIEL